MKKRLSLLWKILLSTSIAITGLFAMTGWFVQQQTLQALSSNLQGEIETSSRAYQAVWQSRTETLRSVSLVLSRMPDVRASFGTRDKATIRDTAQEIWSRISSTTALFLVCDTKGGVIASLGSDVEGRGAQGLGNDIAAVRESTGRFPGQTAGYFVESGRLYELVVTPVYIESGPGPVLLDVLVAGFPVVLSVAEELRTRTGSDFAFIAGGKVIASTLGNFTATDLAGRYQRKTGLQRFAVGNREYGVLVSPLLNIEGRPAGDLLIVRSFDSIQQSLSALQRKLIVVWAAVILFAMGMSFLLARRILRPIQELDRAAARIARQEYDTRVPEGGDDELGRLAHTFNSMSASLQEARRDLIRQERISTIGRLGSSIVHDLRNPLASIYGGAEMLMDGDLNEAQRTRISRTIYRASRSIKEMLQELVDVSRGRVHPTEVCSLSEIITAATETQTAAADSNGVRIGVEISKGIELPLERARIERVFQNLLSNAIDAMPNGGTIEVRAEVTGEAVVVHVEDNGPGIPAEVRQGLFQPFTTSSKNGLGLGLALSRQTVLDHGGDLWVEEGSKRGAHFLLRFPR